MTIDECKNATREHKDNVRKYLYQIIRDLLDRAENHDNSKLEEPELSIFTEYTPKLANSTYGSEEYKQYLKEMQKALEHHYSNNRHHPEFLQGFPDYQGFTDMSMIDMIEMLCDWKSATLRHKNGDLLQSIEINQKRYGYSDDIKKILISTAFYLNLIEPIPKIVGQESYE